MVQSAVALWGQEDLQAGMMVHQLVEESHCMVELQGSWLVAHLEEACMHHPSVAVDRDIDLDVLVVGPLPDIAGEGMMVAFPGQLLAGAQSSAVPLHWEGGHHWMLLPQLG